MDEHDRTDLAELLRARLAAAGLQAPPEDTPRLERDLALHLERITALTQAADLGPADPPLTDPTRAVVHGPGATGSGAVDNRVGYPPGRGPNGPGWG
jgi:hypothetical protein